MSDPSSKRYTLEQRAYMVEQYFQTSSYKIALGRLKKKFKEMPNPKTIQRVVERFKLLTRSKINRDREDHILSRTTIELN